MVGVNANNVFKAIGLASAIINLLLLGSFLLANHREASEATLAISGVMMMLAILAGWAALKGKALWLTIAFAVSFFPFGIYLLGTPEIGRWIGLVNLVYLVSAIGLYRCKGK